MIVSVQVSKNERLISELSQRSGLIPTAIRTETGELIWTDMEGYHFYEGFFRKSVNTHYSLKNKLVTRIISGLDILEDDRIIGNYIVPTGFIFHAGRCGSTAVAKSLARSRKNLVLSEASPISQLLSLFQKRPDAFTAKKEKMLKNLILALCRKRMHTHETAFIKFSSHNIHSFELLRSVFPEVPAIFLKRDRGPIVESFRKKPAGWLKDGMDLEDKVQGFLSKAMSIPDDVLLKFDHKDVRGENLSRILTHFRISPGPEELALMQSQFKYDSKVEFNLKRFGD